MSEAFAALIGALGGIAGMVFLYLSQGRHDTHEKERRKLERRLSSRDEALASVQEYLDGVGALLPDLALATRDPEPVAPAANKAAVFLVAYLDLVRCFLKAYMSLSALGENEAALDLKVLNQLIASEHTRITDEGGALQTKQLLAAMIKVKKHYIDLKGREE